MKDKYKAVWLSHCSIADFLRCPRLYYLRAVYKDPKTGHKITVMSPPLALGQAVHEVVESLSFLPVEERLSSSLPKRLEVAWEKIAGERGGFSNKSQEKEFKERGIAMLERIKEDPGPILKRAIKIRAEGGLPYYWFSEEDNMILCGKIDWLEYLEDEDGVNIIDFKSGKSEEDDKSLQLPIYFLLATNTQNREVKKAHYWYLNRDNGLVEKELPDAKDAYEMVYEVGKRIKLARQLNRFVCPKGGCFGCIPFEKVLRGEGRLVGLSLYKQDIYVLTD